jgi:hypothetical protein
MTGEYTFIKSADEVLKKEADKPCRVYSAATGEWTIWTLEVERRKKNKAAQLGQSSNVVTGDSADKTRLLPSTNGR